MKFPVRTLSAIVMAGFLAATAEASPPTVNAEPMDLDPATNATIMKEKSKRRNMEVSSGTAGDSSSKSSDCGSVNINSNDKKSNSGIKDMFGRQQTTVITGPVINMANCK